MENIIFTNTLSVTDRYNPQPASKEIPDWYKNTYSYVENEKKPVKGITSATIKRCMPVFDAITSGYILYTYTDIHVSTIDGQPYYQWPSFEPLGFHPISQASEHPLRGEHTISIPKWNNPWGIKTPKGYSTLFVNPLHRTSPFTILTGVVDTDTYTAPVNFPFVLNDISFTGVIAAGTPMAQVIPFKRTSWKMALGDEKDFESQSIDSINLRSRFFDSYKTLFRQVKEYK